MNYLVEDVLHFVANAPYLDLSRPRRATSFLTRQLGLMSECFTGLDTFPALQVEPLEFFYTTARSLGCLDRHSLAIMINCSWRGVVWGGWLALMRPDESFAAILARASARIDDNLWPARCALALLEGRDPPPDLMVADELAGRVRSALAPMRIEPTPIRSWPTDEVERAELNAEETRVRDLYRSRGADEAVKVLHDTRLYEYIMPYRRWRALLRKVAAPDGHLSTSTRTQRSH